MEENKSTILGLRKYTSPFKTKNELLVLSLNSNVKLCITHHYIFWTLVIASMLLHNK